jgi:glyoxylase-like metal-dependent hydrolase (beta-lactamase superfamily II)
LTVEYCIVSIGTLSRNRLWNEPAGVRTAHATTTYIQTDEMKMLVDPSLPSPAMAARFNERTGKQLVEITDIFLTTLRPVHRRALEAFDAAKWWVHEPELEAYRRHLDGLLDSADRLSEEDARLVRADMKLLERCQAAPDTFGPQISLFPLPGASAGSCGLLLTPPTRTIAIAGDAAITSQHVRRGQLWEGCVDTETAGESLAGLLEIADVIVPGHDNLMLTPRMQWL